MRISDWSSDVCSSDLATTSARTRSQISAAMTPASTSRVMIWSRVIVPLPDPTLYYGRGPTANIEIVVTFCGRPPSGVQFSSMFLLGFDNGRRPKQHGAARLGRGGIPCDRACQIGRAHV